MLTSLLFPVLALSSRRPQDDVERRVDALLSRMTLEQKIDYIGGFEGFDVRPMPELGLPRIRMSDGPAGVRNYGPDTAYAAPVCLAATWDRTLAHHVGESFAHDARKRNVSIVLAPGVNIARVPMNGRNFEYLGEDPYLAAQMVAPFIRGVQEQGVIATVKHFAANSQEHGRNDYSMDVDPRVLREIYFPAFESAVKDGHAWAVMCAYNLLNGTYCSANHWLLTDVLKKDWGFKGLVMSDWGAVHDTVPVANAGMDLEMPGPEFLNRRTLLPAIESGQVTTATIDDKVRRMLRAFVSMGFLDRPQARPELPANSPEGSEMSYRAALEGSVLLKNEGNILPLNPTRLRRIAVIGPNGDPAVWGGGGSSFTQPFHALSLVEAIKNRLGTAVEVTYESGMARTPRTVYDNAAFQTPDGQPGLLAEYFANPTLSGSPAAVRVDRHVSFNWDGGPAPQVGHDNFSARWTGSFTAAKSGAFEIDAEGDDGFRVDVDGKRVIDEWRDQGTLAAHAAVNLTAGTHTIKAEYYQARGDAVMRLGWRAVEGKEVDAAVRAAKNADAVILSVGFNPEIEGEGEDRTFTLPIGQDKLIRRVVAANPRAIVVLNAGHAVDTTRWLSHVPGFIHAWYPGEDGNGAMAQILFGDACPSGKLPISFDRRWEDSAAYGNYPGDPNIKHVKYAEGLFVGYRHYDKVKTPPLYPFGFGLSYTTFGYTGLQASRLRRPDVDVQISFSVQNTGRRAGDEIAEVYVQPLGAPVPRPVKELKGFERVTLSPGQTRTVVLHLNSRAFAYWDEPRHQWTVAHGAYRILVGGSSRSLPLSATVRL